MTTIADFTAATMDGTDISLDRYLGSVVLVVNTASKCGLTPQFEELEALHRTYRGRGLVVLGFPCQQFAGQEFDGAADIIAFCTTNYGVSFPMFATVDVNGDNAHPLFTWLKDSSGSALGSAVKWNFTKFLVDRNGRFVQRYAPTTSPATIAPDIEAALADSAS